MKRWFVILINFVAVWALAFTSACSAGRPSVQVMGNTPSAVPEVADTPLITSLPPATAQATTGQATTPSGQKRPRPTKSPQDTRQPARGEPSGAVGGLPTGTTTLNPDFIAAEILGSPTDTTITVNIVPAVAIELYYEYGTVKAAYNERSATQIAAAGEAVETTLSGLQPDTRYYYHLRYRSGSGDFNAGGEHTFMTQRAPGSTFTFAIQGDSHPERAKKQFDATLYTRTLQSASTAQPDFYMTIGDDFSVDTLKTVNAESVRSLYINQRQWLGMVEAPVFLVNGNHEQASLANLDGTPDNVAVWAQTARNTYYPQPAPDAFYSGDAEPVEHIGLLQDYYAFTWGEALFVVIDPYWHSPEAVDNPFGVERSEKGKRDMWNITLGETQYQWLKHTLEASTARYKFVFAHHVLGTGRGGIELAGLYEWGGKDRDGSDLFAQKRPGWEKPIHQLMVDNHVTIFFQGHDHIFVRQELDGVIYQTLPEPANPFYTYENDDAYQSGNKFPNSGHVRVTVSPGGVKVDYIRSFLDQPDELAYSYTVKPDPASTPMAGILPTAAPSTGMPAHDPAIPEKTRRPYKPQSPTVSSPASPIPTTSGFNLILGRPTANSISASLYSQEDAQVALAYGVAPGIYITQTAPISLQAGVPQTIELSDLSPNTAYYYQIIVNGDASAEHTFHTQRLPGSSYTFTIDADPHNRDPRFNGELYATTLASVLRDHPDFHINLGDTFMTEKVRPQTYAEAESTFTDMRPYFGIIGMDTPLYLVNGNHEGELGWLLTRDTDKNLPFWSTQLRQQYYPNPKPDDFYSGASILDSSLGARRDGYYAWTWGDALFIVLDPFWYTSKKPQSDDLNNNWNWTLGREQYEWLKSTLETSRAKYRFVFTHHLVGGNDKDARGGIEAASYFEWGGKSADSSYGFDEHRPGWGKPIHQLLVENHVNAVFHGHDHVFVRQELDGIVYQEVPQPSNAEYNKTGLAADYGYIHGDELGGSGHLRVTVSPAGVKVDYIRSYLDQADELAFSYTVK